MHSKRCSTQYAMFALLLLAAIGAVGITLYRQQYTIVLPDTIRDELDKNGRLRPLLKFASAARDLKLITVTVNSSVTASSTDDIWRGAATGTVTVPVKYGYGIDMSGVRNSAFSLKPYSGQFFLLLPRPQRLTTEIDTTEAQTQIDVTGTRTKGRAGQTQLQLAFKKLTEEAARQTLPLDQREKIDKTTLEQVEAVLKKLLPEGSTIVVRYDQ